MSRLVLIAGLIAGCAGAPPIATGLDAERSHVALAELQDGRAQLVGKCSGCHHTPLPSEHARAEWPHQLDEMSERAHLGPAERRLIEEYLVAMAPR